MSQVTVLEAVLVTAIMVSAVAYVSTFEAPHPNPVPDLLHAPRPRRRRQRLRQN